MRTFGKILPGLFVLFFVFSVAGAKNQGFVSGHVTWEGGYGYISDATVYLYDLSSRLIDSAQTNFKGIFEIAVPAGAYYVSAEKDNLVKEYYPDAYLLREASAVHVSQGQYVQIDFALDSGGWISGAFGFEGSDEPAGLITAVKINQPHEGWYKSLTLNGPFPSAYAIQGLLPGIYKILGRARGKRTEYYPGVNNIDQAEPIDIIKDVGISNIGFNLNEVGWGYIRGQVYNRNDGNGISGQTLYAYQWHDFWQDPNLMEITSEPDGTYRLNIPAGDYFLFTIYSSDDGNRMALYYNDCYDPTSAEVIHIGAGQTVDRVNFGIDYSVTHDLTISGSISARATGYGLNNVIITAIDYETGHPAGSACSNNDGSFRVGDWAPGQYLLMFSGTYIIPYFYPQAYNWQDGGVIRLQSYIGNVRTEAITEDYGNNGLMIAGLVRSSARPLVGARVYATLVGESDPIAYARTDASGSYAIVSGLIPGYYTVTCDLYGYYSKTYPNQVYLDLMNNPQATNINFSLDNVFTGVVDNVQPGNRITISGNYPNPFNSKTLIRVYSDRSVEISTRISVFNILGQMVGDKAVIIKPGYNYLEWGAGDFMTEVSSGAYFYRFGDFGDTYRMILLK
jgi:hypothetical protein